MLTNKLLATGVLLLAISGGAQAYTVVLRSGERVEIPDSFRLIGAAITYEIAPSFNRTIQLNVVDIAATERANNEAAGSLLRRAETADVRMNTINARAAKQPARAQSRAGEAAKQSARPSLTNRDLEALRQRHEERGQAYELERRAMPTMSAEDKAKRAAEELKALREFAAQRHEEIENKEAAFRVEAQRLRLESAETDAELRYYRARLIEVTPSSSLTSLATPATTLAGIPPVAYPYSFGGIISGGIFGNTAVGVPLGGNVNTINSARHSSLGARVNINGGVRGGLTFGNNYVRRSVRGVRAVQPYQYGYPLGYGFPLVGYPPVSDDVLQIRARIRDLEAARQRLMARRRLLEDEARRAGVAPGVLRP